MGETTSERVHDDWSSRRGSGGYAGPGGTVGPTPLTWGPSFPLPWDWTECVDRTESHDCREYIETKALALKPLNIKRRPRSDTGCPCSERRTSIQTDVLSSFLFSVRHSWATSRLHPYW